MAKWGEGDPRWIVEERADATNVNNWHWTEKDASSWSKHKLKALLLNLKVEDEQGNCEITEVSKLDGEASVNNRKAKLIFFYEWVISLEWKGTLKDCKTEISGNVDIPNLSDENNVDEVDIEVTIKKAAPESNILKDIMRKKGTVILRSKLQEYIASLKEEYSQGVILPTKQTKPSPGHLPRVTKKEIQASFNDQGTNTNNLKNLEIGVKIDTAKISMKEHFNCSVEDIYECLTDPQRVQAFTRAPADMQVVQGGKFVMLDGNILGTFSKLVKNKQIVQKWRFKSWPDEHYSTVVMDFTQKPDGAEVELTQTSVPSSDFIRTKEGWQRHFWSNIKATFGYGGATNFF